MAGRQQMVVERNGARPEIAPSARIAPTAQLIGDVRVGDECVIDYGAVIASSGPPVVLESGVVVMPNAVVRSVGGRHRPPFPVSIGSDSLIGPLAALAGCAIGAACYVATGVMVFHGATVGAGSRLGAGSVVHTGSTLPPGSRVGMRQFAVPDGEDETVITSELDQARDLLARADFFTQAFAIDEPDLETLHRRSTALLRAEANDWLDLPRFGD